MELLFLGAVILLIVIVLGVPKGRHPTDKEERQQPDTYDPESDRNAHVNAYINAIQAGNYDRTVRLDKYRE